MLRKACILMGSRKHQLCRFTESRIWANSTSCVLQGLIHSHFKVIASYYVIMRRQTLISVSISIISNNTFLHVVCQVLHAVCQASIALALSVLRMLRVTLLVLDLNRSERQQLVTAARVLDLCPSLVFTKLLREQNFPPKKVIDPMRQKCFWKFLQTELGLYFY